MNVLKRILVSLVLVFVSNCLLASTAHGKEQAAIVIIASGDFYALNKTSIKRSLKRRSKIFVGDTLVTGKKGQGQVRFIDGAVVSLRPDTELRINDYRYGNGEGDESSVLTLIKGGFRTITGAIGKEHYKVNSSLATIGIRGTHYEAVIADKQMYVALWQGGVTVKNDGGQIDLGLGASYNFASVSATDKTPKGLVSPPAAIINNKQPAIAPSLSKNSTTSDDNGSTTDSEKNSEQTNLANFDAGESEEPTMGGLPPVRGPVDPPIKPYNPCGTATTEECETTITTTTDPVETLNLDRVGVAFFNNAPNGFIGGQSTSGSDGSPTIYDNDRSPADAGFKTATPLYALLRGEATISDFGSATIDADHKVYWGAWNATAAAPATLQSDPDGSKTEQDIASTIYWLTVQPTANMPTTGVHSYYNTVAALGGGSAVGAISGFNMYASVDFAAATISGNMSFSTSTGGTRDWYVAFNGAPNGAVFDVNVDTATSSVNGNNVNGDIAAVFTGTNAEAIAGGFNVRQADDSRVNAQGIFVVKR